MGSIITTVGNKGGKPLFTFTGASQDSQCIFSTAPPYVPPSRETGAGTGTATGDLPMGYKNVLFQLTGVNTAGSVLVFGTIDIPTAQGLAQEWVPLPAPATEAAYQWSNPLTKAFPGQAVLAVDKPFIAYRALSSADFVGNAVLQVLASP
jgi:hypothetical protein